MSESDKNDFKIPKIGDVDTNVSKRDVATKPSKLHELFNKFQSKLPNHNAKQSDFSRFSFLKKPLILAISWILIWLFSLLIIGGDLRKLPVMVGDLSSLSWFGSIYKFYTAWVLKAGVVGILTIPLKWLFSLLVILISSFVTMFVHANLMHLLSNLLLLGLILLIVYFAKLTDEPLVKKWMFSSLFVIVMTWSGLEILSYLTSLFALKLQFFKMFLNNNVPIVGASVGLYALLGYLLIRISGQRSLKFGVKAILFLIVMLGLMFLIYSQLVIWIQANDAAKIGNAQMVAVMLHILGIVFGICDGVVTNRRMKWRLE